MRLKHSEQGIYSKYIEIEVIFLRGIALEGGGARGSFHIGALLALRELGITYDCVTGASIGAINGAILAQGELDHLEDIWRMAQIGDMIQGDIDLIKQIVNLEFKSDYAKIRQFLMDTFRQGGLDVSPFKEKLRGFIDEEALRRSKIAFGLVTLSITDLKPIEAFIEDIPQGKLHDYILASANFPAFKDEKFDNQKMLDGCFFDNLPVNMLAERGCDEVIAIRLMSFGRIRKVKDKNVKVTTIIPSEDLGRTLEVDPIRAAHNIELGYFDTMRVMKGLRGRKYYVDQVPSEDAVIQSLLKISDGTLDGIAQLIGLKKPHKRMLFEDFLPMMAELLKMEEPFTYSDLVIAFYEFLAEQMGLNRLQILAFPELLQLVQEHYKNLEALGLSGLNEMAQHLMALIPTKGFSLLPHKLKSQLLVQIFFTLYKNGYGYGIISQ